MRVDEQMIELAEVPVFYRSAGAGSGTLYLHGVPTSSEDWIPFLERIGGVAPDMIGFGRSGKGGHLDFTIEGLAGFVEQFVAALGLERVSLVMHDWGAGPGLLLAQRHPDLVERMVLINAVPLLPGFRWPLFARTWRRPVIGELAMGSTSRRVLARMLRAGTATPDGFSRERIDAVWEQFDQGTQRAILRLYRSADESRLASEGADLARVTAPTLVIWGDKDPWLPFRFAEAYAKALPAGTPTRVAGAGHWPWLDDPDVIERVAQFLG